MSLLYQRQKRLIMLSIVRSVMFVHYSVVQSCHDSFDLIEENKRFMGQVLTERQNLYQVVGTHYSHC
jgi:hypothetical protein